MDRNIYEEIAIVTKADETSRYHSASSELLWLQLCKHFRNVLMAQPSTVLTPFPLGVPRCCCGPRVLLRHRRRTSRRSEWHRVNRRQRWCSCYVRCRIGPRDYPRTMTLQGDELRLHARRLGVTCSQRLESERASERSLQGSDVLIYALEETHMEPQDHSDHSSSQGPHQVACASLWTKHVWFRSTRPSRLGPGREVASTGVQRKR